VNFLALVAMALSKIHPAMVFNCFFLWLYKESSFSRYGKNQWSEWPVFVGEWRKNYITGRSLSAFGMIWLPGFQSRLASRSSIVPVQADTPKASGSFPGFLFYGNLIVSLH
jgi:hypothetical protein